MPRCLPIGKEARLGEEVYGAVRRRRDILLAPQMLKARPAELNCDFVQYSLRRAVRKRSWRLRERDGSTAAKGRGGDFRRTIIQLRSMAVPDESCSKALHSGGVPLRKSEVRIVPPSPDRVRGRARREGEGPAFRGTIMLRRLESLSSKKGLGTRLNSGGRSLLTGPGRLATFPALFGSSRRIRCPPPKDRPIP